MDKKRSILNLFKRISNRTFPASAIIEAYKQGAEDLAKSYDTIEFKERMKTYLKERFNIQEK